ncbi:MAG: vitamin K epoxide reductase family protein [Vicinamibacterales bacterium]
MARKPAQTTGRLSASPPRVAALAAFALLGLGTSSASAWVHYRLLRDPTYTSVCDVSSTVSCTDAYASAYGSLAGVPVAVVGVWFFVLVLGLIVLCRRSPTAAPNLPGYVFAMSTVGLAVVLYLAYASFFVLNAVCVLCVGTYLAVIGLFVTSGAATKVPMTSLPSRAIGDLRTLVHTPAALMATLAVAVAAVAGAAFFPEQPVGAHVEAATARPTETLAAPPQEIPASALQQLEQMLAQSPRVPIMVPKDGAAVLLVKFNDYQCPPCRQTYMEYKPVLARYEQQHPGKVKLVTKDYPLDPECNSLAPGGGHAAACEAAVAVRLAREKGRSLAMEEWLFANQATVTPASVREAARTVGNVADFEARYPTTLELVRADIAQGGQLQVRGTPTFFMNGIRLPNLPAELLDAAIAFELKRNQQ